MSKNEQFYYKLGQIYTETVVDEYEKREDIETHMDSANSDRWFWRFILEQKQRRAFKLRYVAVFLLMLTLTTSILSVIGEARGFNVIKMLFDVQVRYTELHFEDNIEFVRVEDAAGIPDDWVSYYYLSLIPKGYSVADTSTGLNDKWIIYKDDEGNRITFMQASTDMTAQIDTENAVVKEIEVNGLNGFMSLKEEVTILTWHDNTNSFILSGKFSSEVMLKLAESIKYEK